MPASRQSETKIEQNHVQIVILDAMVKSTFMKFKAIDNRGTLLHQVVFCFAGSR